MKHFEVLLADGTQFVTIEPIEQCKVAENGGGVVQFFGRETSEGRLPLGIVPVYQIKYILLVDDCLLK